MVNTLREKCPSYEFFLINISCIQNNNNNNNNNNNKIFI